MAPENEGADEERGRGPQAPESPVAPAASDAADAPAESPSEQRSTEKEKSKGLASTISTWASTVLTLVKALVALAVAVIVLVTLIKVLRTSYTHKTVAVEVDPVAQKLIDRMGLAFDLRSFLVSEVSRKQKAIESLVKMHSSELIEDQEPISLKVVGVDISTRTLSELLDRLIGPPARYHVRIGLTCPGTSCDAFVDRDETSAGKAFPRELRLVVDLKGDGADERISRRLPITNPGFRHDFRLASNRVAEEVVLMTNRQAASVLFLNVGTDLEFLEDSVDYESRAAAATFDDKPRSEEEKCLARTVYGVSLEMRGDLEAAATVLSEAGRGTGSPSVCRVHCLTNLARVRNRQAYQAQSKDASMARFQEASKALDSIGGPAPNRTEGIRISAFRIGVEATKLEDALNRDRKTNTPERQRDVYASLAAIISSIERELPAADDQLYVHSVIHETLTIARTAWPFMDLPGRARSTLDLLRLIDGYLVGDSAPRQLLLVQGVLEQALAITFQQSAKAPAAVQKSVRMVLSSNPGASSSDAPDWEALVQKHSLASLIALETAGRSPALPTPLETTSVLEPSAAAGDLFFLFNETSERAVGNYSDAIKAYFEQDLPSSETYLLAETVAKWAIWWLGHHDCASAHAESLVPMIELLGAQSWDGLCSFALAGPQPLAAPAGGRGVWKVIYPLVMTAVQTCYPGPKPGAAWLSFEERLKVIECVGRQHQGWIATQPIGSSLIVDRAIDGFLP